MTTHTGAMPPQAAPPLDWGLGHYERTAAALVPAAQTLVAAAALRPGEHVLDLGCGTGTVALMAARAGAHTVAVEPAARLRDVTRGVAAASDLEIPVLDGEAARLPVEDGAFDAVLSNFAVIFAPDPVAAAAEMVRVLAPHGRIVLTAWLPGGALSSLNAAAMEMVQAVVGGGQPRPGFDWSDERQLAGLFAPYGLEVQLQRHEISFTDESPAAYLAAEQVSHPMAVAGFGVLERAGKAAAAQARLLAILEEQNEDPRAFKATGRYVVVTVTRRREEPAVPAAPA